MPVLPSTASMGVTVPGQSPRLRVATMDWQQVPVLTAPLTAQWRPEPPLQTLEEAGLQAESCNQSFNFKDCVLPSSDASSTVAGTLSHVSSPEAASPRSLRTALPPTQTVPWVADSNRPRSPVLPKREVSVASSLSAGSQRPFRRISSAGCSAEVEFSMLEERARGVSPARTTSPTRAVSTAVLTPRLVTCPDLCRTMPLGPRQVQVVSPRPTAPGTPLIGLAPAAALGGHTSSSFPKVAQQLPSKHYRALSPTFQVLRSVV